MIFNCRECKCDKTEKDIFPSAIAKCDWLCRDCTKKVKRPYRQKYYLEHKERCLKNSRAWASVNKDRLVKANRKSHLKCKYNLTVEAYNKLLVDHNHECKICKSTWQLSVDHCHTTGKVRGILCRKCNSALGLLKENRQAIKNLLNYIEGESWYVL